MNAEHNEEKRPITGESADDGNLRDTSLSLDSNPIKGHEPLTSDAEGRTGEAECFKMNIDSVTHDGEETERHLEEIKQRDAQVCIKVEDEDQGEDQVNKAQQQQLIGSHKFSICNLLNLTNKDKQLPSTSTCENIQTYHKGKAKM